MSSVGASEFWGVDPLGAWRGDAAGRRVARRRLARRRLARLGSSLAAGAVATRGAAWRCARRGAREALRCAREGWQLLG
jgi:hypothetical protein